MGVKKSVTDSKADKPYDLSTHVGGQKVGARITQESSTILKYRVRVNTLPGI